jgi:endonuclease
VRLIVARCEVTYTGRLNAYLPESTRLLMLKDDGSVLVHADAGGYKPLNWMTPPTVFEQSDDTIVVRKRAGRSEDRLEIRLLDVLSDVTHDMGEAAGLQKDGVERDLQLLLADQPAQIEEGLRLVVARCTASYSGRLTTHLPEGVRLLMIKDDGTFMIWSDGGGSKVKPLNCIA